MLFRQQNPTGTTQKYLAWVIVLGVSTSVVYENQSLIFLKAPHLLTKVGFQNTANLLNVRGLFSSQSLPSQTLSVINRNLLTLRRVSPRTLRLLVPHRLPHVTMRKRGAAIVSALVERRYVAL